MDPGKSRTRGAHPGSAKIAAATNRKPDPSQDSRPHRQRQPIAYATRYLPVGKGSYDWLVVRRCPYCQCGHRHVLFENTHAPVERAPACARHKTYTVVVTEVMPSRMDREAIMRGIA